MEVFANTNWGPVIIVAILAIVFLVGIIYIPVILILRSHSRDSEEMKSFMRFAHIESERYHREAEKNIREVQKFNRENSLYLRMIFKRVDKPSADES